MTFLKLAPVRILTSYSMVRRMVRRHPCRHQWRSGKEERKICQQRCWRSMVRRHPCRHRWRSRKEKEKSARRSQIPATECVGRAGGPTRRRNHAQGFPISSSSAFICSFSLSSGLSSRAFLHCALALSFSLIFRYAQARRLDGRILLELIKCCKPFCFKEESSFFGS